MMPPPEKKSPLPWIILGALVLIGAGLGIYFATRSSGGTSTGGTFTFTRVFAGRNSFNGVRRGLQLSRRAFQHHPATGLQGVHFSEDNSGHACRAD